MTLKANDRVTLYTIGLSRVIYRSASVYRSDGDLVLRDPMTNKFFESAYDPNSTRQDFRTFIEKERNPSGTRTRAIELWAPFAHARLRATVAGLLKDMASEKGLETTYNAPYFEVDSVPFKDHWLREFSKIVPEPDISDETGQPITEHLRPWKAK